MWNCVCVVGKATHNEDDGPFKATKRKIIARYKIN